jgi:hypothetical protein
LNAFFITEGTYLLCPKEPKNKLKVRVVVARILETRAEMPKEVY